MSRKSIVERRADKMAEMEAIRRELVQLDAKAAERIGKLAVRAGLADIDLEDDAWVKEFQALATKFHGRAKTSRRPASESAGADGASDGAATV